MTFKEAYNIKKQASLLSPTKQEMQTVMNDTSDAGVGNYRSFGKYINALDANGKASGVSAVPGGILPWLMNSAKTAGIGMGSLMTKMFKPVSKGALNNLRDATATSLASRVGLTDDNAINAIKDYGENVNYKSWRDIGKVPASVSDENKTEFKVNPAFKNLSDEQFDTLFKGLPSVVRNPGNTTSSTTA